MAKMRVFLTGSRGMVGHNFLEHAHASYYTVYAPSSQELDLTDYGATFSIVQNFKPDIIVHCAGKVGGIQANIREPVSFLINNLDMGRNIVWAAYNSGVKRLINLGSSCMYPRDAKNPLVEENIMKGELEPTNEGYALAKITVARLCEYLTRENSDVFYKTLIPCNIYGRYDKFDAKHSHMVPAIIRKMHDAKINGMKVVDIWGDGQARREFMYAEDLADCMWECVSRFNDVPQYMNVGLGYDHTINDYYKACARVTGYEGTFVHDLTKPVGMNQKLVSVQALEKWGWRAKISLEAGLRETYLYYLEQ
jgi:GDP-L-fucose synthase